jgi:hypothetical protein
VKWQPIETAPKDGTDIILGAPVQEYQGRRVEPRSTIGHWDTGAGFLCDIDDDGDPSWMSWDGGFTTENPPTHWMPLPEPPED